MNAPDPQAPPPDDDAGLAGLVELHARDFRDHPFHADGREPLTIEAGRVCGHYHGLRLRSQRGVLLAAGEHAVARLAQTLVSSAAGQPLSAWAPYAIAVDAAAITHLDRLIRTVHVLDAHRRGGTGPLWLPVHPLHLGAVADAHGAAFATILRRSGLQPAGVVLELTDCERVAPPRLATAIANFRSRGYGIAFGVRAGEAEDLLRLLALAPDAVRLGAAHLRAAAAGAAGYEALVRRIDTIRAHGVRAWLPEPAGAVETALLPGLGADGWLVPEAAPVQS